MKKLVFTITAATMFATGPAIAQSGGEGAVNTPMDTMTSPSNTPAKSQGSGPMEASMQGDGMDGDMSMPPPTTMPPRSSTMPPPPQPRSTMPSQQQPRIQYQPSQMPAGATTPSVPGGEYPACTREVQDACVNPGAR